VNDARIRFINEHPASSDFFRLEDSLLTPDDAMEMLACAGFNRSEARDYLNALPLEGG
jgi:hypothetical protein